MEKIYFELQRIDTTRKITISGIALDEKSLTGPLSQELSLLIVDYYSPEYKSDDIFPRWPEAQKQRVTVSARCLEF